MSVSKTTAALVAAVLTMSLILLSPVSARAGTGPSITGFSLGQFGASSVVVDDARSMVLVAGSTANAVDVFGFSGDLLQAIPNEAGTSGLAIVGSTAYVSDKTSGVIDRIDLDTLSSDGPLATRLTDPASMAVTGGRLWVSTAAGLAAVDTSSGTVSMFPSPTSRSFRHRRVRPASFSQLTLIRFQAMWPGLTYRPGRLLWRRPPPDCSSVSFPT